MKIRLQYWFAGYDEHGHELGAQTPDQFLFALRDVRDILLKECDWTIAIDSPLDETTRQGWISFRQMLRDLPSQYDVSSITPVIEIQDPPASGKPRTWVNLDPDYFPTPPE
jgi:hypothetical protein